MFVKECKVNFKKQIIHPSGCSNIRVGTNLFHKTDGETSKILHKHFLRNVKDC